jgi:imidazoleglycerol phosphate synthase glutamine amidotransferase subunit HisH
VTGVQTCALPIYTTGLGLIPGQVQPLQASRWHIGWNSVEVTADDALLQPSDGQALYFNHSYVFHAPAEYTVAVSRIADDAAPGVGDAFTVAVRRGHIVGLQFHPEKSQLAGRELLRNVIEGLVA